MKLLITESQLNELRGSYLSHIIKKTKELTGEEWPEYVLQDWLYKTTKIREDYNIEEYIKKWLNSFGKGTWTQDFITINIDVFDEETKNELKVRMLNKDKNLYNIEKDKERLSTQDKLIKNKPSDEPIIVVKINDKYKLIEGWHRTIISLEKFNEYKQKAYIYIPNEN